MPCISAPPGVRSLTIRRANVEFKLYDRQKTSIDSFIGNFTSSVLTCQFCISCLRLLRLVDAGGTEFFCKRSVVGARRYLSGLTSFNV